MSAINRAGAPDPRAISELLNASSHSDGKGRTGNDWAVAFSNVDSTRVKRDAVAARAPADGSSDTPLPEGKTGSSKNDLGVECIDAEAPENEPATMVHTTA